MTRNTRSVFRQLVRSILSYYLQEDGFWSFEWLLNGYPWDSDYAPGAFLLLQGVKLWIAPLLLFLLAPIVLLFRPKTDSLYSKLLLFCGIGGLAWLLGQGFAIGIQGFQFDALDAAFGELGDRQFGLGYGALLLGLSFLFMITNGAAAKGAVNGDVFVVSAIGFVVAMVGIFIFFPIVKMLTYAFVDGDGIYSIGVFVDKFLSPKIWGLGCLDGTRGCGAAWNSLFLAILVGLITTTLGLIFALVATRSGFKYVRVLRALTVLPIITPPFVIGLAIILLFGLSGSVTTFFADLFGLTPTRWIYSMCWALSKVWQILVIHWCWVETSMCYLGCR